MTKRKNAGCNSCLVKGSDVPQTGRERDETADRNLNIRSIFAFGTGLATLFTKVGATYGFGEPEP